MTCVSTSAPLTKSLAVVRLCRSFSCEDELAIPPVPLDQARQVDPMLTVPISEQRVESFHVYSKEIGRRRSGRERRQPQRPGAHGGRRLQKNSDIENHTGRRRGREGQLRAIPQGMKGTFTASYRVKVPFIRSGVG